MNSQVCHLTSAHSRYDTRIFLKECQSLAKAGYDVFLIVADGKGDEIKNNIKIYDVGKSKGRIQRILKTTKKVFQKAKLIDVEIYHIHDPELMPIGVKLKKIGKKVIFDAHEDLPQQLLSKPYLTKNIRKILSKILSTYEKKACEKIDAIITATPFIKEKFLKINNNTIDVNNFPILNELFEKSITDYAKKKQICYIGGLSKIRGAEEIMLAMGNTKKEVKLIIGGKISDLKKENLQSFFEYKIENLGFIDRNNVKKVLSESIAGIVTFLPVPNHIHSQPNKMFEYMSAGIAVIASDFPLWKEIIEKNNCGICVDPLKPKEIANAINYLVDHPNLAKEMGENGRLAVEKYYNWSIEEKKLIKLYAEL
jgi:glycosyltransferase involved in cell wall biosynthesis